MDVNATAALPMYDLAEVRRLTDDWWRGLTRHSYVQNLLQFGLTMMPSVLSGMDGA